MKTQKKNTLYNFLDGVVNLYHIYRWLFFLIYIALFLLYVGYHSLNVKSVEHFTPQIRQLYRPKLRQLHDVYENFSNHAKYIMMKRLKTNNLY
jgi:hypothetical protein